MIKRVLLIKLSILALLAFLVLGGGLCKKPSDPKALQLAQPTNLVYWRVWDDQSSFDQMIQAYQKLHSNVTITYRRLRYEEYEQEILKALAEDRAPDIVSIHNTWLEKYQELISPLPAVLELPVKEVTGPKFKQETRYALQQKKTLNLADLRRDYVDVVAQDVIKGEQIYGLPLSLDTLVLYYNRDLLNNAKIPQAPTNWNEFAEAVKKLTFQNEEGKIIQAGAALGTANNIPRAFDILSLIMMQNGTQMTNDTRSFTTFHLPPAGSDYNPAQEALVFYTDFANPPKAVYTWNKDQPDALEAFTSGQLAFFFGYSYHLPLIKSKAPRLNLGIAKIPQIAGASKEINYANYWVETVMKKTKSPNFAWDFLLFASQPENVATYLTLAQKPTALRALVTAQLEEENIQIFADQVLTSQSWYAGKDSTVAEEAFKTMITEYLAGEKPVQEIMNFTAAKINNSWK